MTRSERTGSASMRRENARLSRQVADLKRRIEELERGPGAPLANPASRSTLPAAQDIHEQTIRQIIDLVPHFLFAKDIDGRFILVNQATASAFGLTVREMTGRKEDELSADPALVARYRSDDLEVIRSGRIKHIAEEPFIDGRGRERWQQTIKVPYRTADSGKPAILCVSQDITEQKQALEALRESELRLSNHITHTPVAVIVWDVNYVVKEWNSAAEKIFGYSADEAIGHNAMILVVPEKDRKYIDDFIQRVLEHEGGVRNTSENVTKDGRTVFVEWYNTPLRNAAGKTTGVAALALDVTEHRRAAAALAESENKYRSLFETSLDGILFTDPEGKIQEANPAFLQMLGYDIAELRGRSLDDISHPEWREQNRTIREKILAGPYGEYEKEYLHRDGRQVPVSIHAWPVGDGDGPPARFMGIIRDISERKAAETALEESQQLLRTVTDNLPAIISYLDENGCYRFANKAYEDWYGRPRNEFIGMNVYELIDEKSFNLWEPYFRRALTGEAVKFDIERDYPKLGRRTMEITYVPDVAADGHVRGLFGLGQDVTDRRAAEEALRKSEAGLAEAQRIAKIGSWERHIESGKEQWSDQHFRIYGHEPSAFEPSYDDFLRHVHPNDLDRVKSANEKLAKDGQDYDIIFRTVRADSVERVMSSHVRVFRNEAYKPIRFAGTVRDITEQIEAEEALRKSEQNLRGIMENVADGVITIDERATIQSFNRSAEKMFGYPAEQVIGRNVELLMPEPERSLHPGFVKRYLETGSGKLIGQGPREVLGQRKDGATFPMELAVSEMLVGGQRTFIGTMRDASERKLVEEQLRQAQKMEAVGQLTGGVAHDFNNLLTVMLGNLELVREHLNGDADATRMIERAVQAAGRGAALTNRLLAFSRKQVLQPEAINLDILVSEMADMLVRTLGETIEVNTLAKDELWLCDVDVSQMESTILNLAINARDAMPGGGALTIETANLSESDARAAVPSETTPREYVMLAVSDTGTGMPSDVLLHAFEPFFSTKDVGQGSGLGLSMVYGFARQSGGHAVIDSEEGKGSTVKIFLPRSSARCDGGKKHPLDAVSPSARGERVLVVEDDADVRALAIALLGNLGYEVLEAATAKAALEVVERAPAIDLLLSDIVLPGGMNGRDLASEIQRRRPAVKLLYMSGYTEGAISTLAGRNGGPRLLQKPFKKADFAAAVRQALDGGEALA